ncbi:MAG: SH3 domain-containing protein [Elainellaceae cyanobacterium]
MKHVIIATTIVLSLLAQPAAAQDRDGSRWESSSTSQRLERLRRDRRTLERLESPSRHRTQTNSEWHYPDSHRRDALHRDPIYRDSRGSVRHHRNGRSVFGVDGDRGVVIFSPDRTTIIQQRDRNERRDVIQVDQGRLAYPTTAAPTITIHGRQQQTPRLLHGQTIAPFVAQIYAQDTLEGHEGPSTVYPIITRFAPGQMVTATQAAGGADGVQWYLVASGQGQYAWVRGDRLLVETR